MQAVSVFCALALTAVSAEFFRALQATGYRPQRGYFRLCLTPYYAVLLVAQAATVAAVELWKAGGEFVNLGVLAALAVGTNLIRRKSPLKLTKRMWRMLAAECVVITVLCVFVNASWWLWLLPVLALFGWGICLPVDLLINRRYVRLAQAKLRQSGVKVIAVTGSYGKTSVKDMLAALLENSLTPSGSCNTPLGIAAYVNRTELNGVKYLVLEFGARKKGDVAELCRLYSPSYGIVTGVCAQHLSTFKSLHNVILTKRELVECLPSDGFCVLNRSNGIVQSYFNSGVCAKYLSTDDLQIEVKKVDFDGTTLLVNGTNTVTLPQIADYTADTFAMCLQTATRLGQPVSVTLANAAKVKPTPHRLQLIEGQGFHILDDSYNASLAGVASCCKTLKKFDCVKAVISQGLVECGKLADEMNAQCGRMLGEVCAAAVVLGKNRKALVSGLSQTNCKVIEARNLEEAVRLAAPFAVGGILIFQNDLPDVAVL